MKLHIDHYILTVVVFRTVFKISTHKAKNSLFSPPYSCLTPHAEEPREYPHISYISRN